MARHKSNTGKSWTSNEERRLETLAKQNTPTRLIAWDLERTVAGVRSKASELGISLKPTNQKPYNRRK